ncbi:hypothetical protein ACWGII_17515 [Streptomyces sp. NPDC054855]
MSGTTPSRDDRKEPQQVPERGSGRFSDGPPDPLASMLAKVDKGEHISTPGDHAGGDERDPDDELHREYDHNGRFAQGRKRKN